MVRNVTLFLAGLLSLVLIALQWSDLVYVVHVLLGH